MSHICDKILRTYTLNPPTARAARNKVQVSYISHRKGMEMERDPGHVRRDGGGAILQHWGAVKLTGFWLKSDADTPAKSNEKLPFLLSYLPNDTAEYAGEASRTWFEMYKFLWSMLRTRGRDREG